MEIARRENFVAHKGVYVAVTGPNLETRAEYRFLRGIGADVVGMSTVPEVIVAVHAGMRVLGLSIVTDLCLPDALEPADINRILRTAAEAEPKLAKIVLGVLAAGERRADVRLVRLSPHGCCQASFQDPENRKVLVQIGPVQSGAVADDFDIGKLRRQWPLAGDSWTRGNRSPDHPPTGRGRSPPPRTLLTPESEAQGWNTSFHLLRINSTFSSMSSSAACEFANFHPLDVIQGDRFDPELRETAGLPNVNVHRLVALVRIEENHVAFRRKTSGIASSPLSRAWSNDLLILALALSESQSAPCNLPPLWRGLALWLRRAAWG